LPDCKKAGLVVLGDFPEIDQRNKQAEKEKPILRFVQVVIHPQ
jgi:hypothetical protein